jgi:GMP reductase
VKLKEEMVVLVPQEFNMSTIKALTYDDVYLVPKYSELETRKNADTTVRLGEYTFRIPVLPSNMKTVIDETWAEWFSKNGYFYMMHRFDNITVPFVKAANEKVFDIISISTGVNDDSYQELLDIHYNGWRVDYITIDVAHGHHIKVKNRIEEIRKLFPDVFIIAGNVTTADGVEFLENCGADATRIGIGPGKACTTKFQTGFHVPIFSAVLECASVAKKPIFADGGVNHYGDVAKALVAGATFVMAGAMFAACSDSPAPTINGRKVYYGSASKHNKGHNDHIEGTLLELEAQISLEERMKEITQALQSSISYAGGKDLSCFQGVYYVTV